jgi:signal transduction histidine kinase
VTAPELTLLLVDDDAVDRMTIRRLLREARLRVAVKDAATPDEAIATLRHGGIGCVLLDYNLPGANGLEVLQAIRAAGLRVPVVALTGQGDDELAASLMRAGAADYLNKNTLTADKLERGIRYAVSLHRSEEERTQLLQREQQAREEAQRANRAKDEFLAMLSHELRTPLNAILGWTTLLQKGQLPPDTRVRAINIIERNTRLQAQLIEDLLDISRITRGKLRLEFQHQPLAAIVDAAVDAVRPAAAAKQISLAIDIPDDDTTLLCDPSRMQQVIWNLLTNAIKFSPDGGHVDVTVFQEPGRFCVSVADSGPGIDPDFLPHVFDPFRQQEGHVVRQHGGLGLGLAIVQHIVELHGGSVSVTGGPGGATFVVSVPVQPEAVAAT